ncbi:hypothetical protein [Candidatus Symbiopectobacterium sp. NZEC135]|uniref:hypothetical protein n=1 Tax=Candidatus Symbiopectobacterium sp. NZEC135 TaxID=2820471 RepID=UPI002225F2EF|nr:hypothetical protein [Candidatus Symbiopectobacterium sp. NZEC135]MCW2477711.1 hypothetical protein [Candidatus Symbiopectobacterium sp. NZEC135]
MSEIKEEKTVWLTLTNDDLTEGRGYQRVLHVCETEETAIRLGKKKYVQGSNCPVEKSIAVKIGHEWFVPGNIESESTDDKKLRLINESRNAVIEKMRQAGFTEEEISKLNK